MPRKRATTAKARRPMKSPEQEATELAVAIGLPARQIERGGLARTTVVDLDGSLGGKRMSMVPVLLNRGGTAVERWLAYDERRPSAQRLFGEHERRAIHYTQNLWTRADGHLAAIDLTADKVDAPLGWAQQEAIVELKRLAERVPKPFWQCYENVVRWDEEAGSAGSRLANNSRSAIDAARTTVAFTASLIAMWRRL